MHDSIISDVVIVGAGPVGLFLACELRLADLSVLVLEQAPDPDSPLKCLPFGMRGLSSPTIEAFYRRGLLDAVVAKKTEQNPAAASAHWMQQARKAGGHFAGIQFYKDRLDNTKWPYRLDGPCQTNMVSDMAHLESLLAARAIALGAEIRRDAEVKGFSQSDDEVIIRTRSHTFRAGWLVGCDGGRSTVRKAGDFGFTGTEPQFTGYSAQIELADPDQLAPGRHYTSTGMYTYQQSGTLAMVDFDGGTFHRTQPITLDHIQAVLRQVSGIAVTVTALKLAATWTDRAFQAQVYRKKRVLLAGDAAHIHSPLGGQGLNLGIGDAMNLGWKLAATIRGNAPRDLLDSYYAERHPVGAQILDWSRAQVELMRPSPSSRALAAIMRDLIETPDGATYFADRIWGLSLRYDLGENHPLVGRSAPDFEMADGTRLGEHLRHGKGVLLDFSTDAALQALVRRWDKRIVYVGSDARDKLGLTSVLVRPDGIVAWIGEGPLDEEKLSHAATRWFGDAGAPIKPKDGS
ncbi:2-polyprenyl-6-methoxyphenol hydroxylase-like oxidoreductase [Herbaspirillum sp. CF444]|uniref:FAD-dependent monooxygenase n=1 Tax=Herbaspirillum sp. CF444 TaxID=1144319 RepID=UPI0002727969|nr:FAD-dependent monooxygenase [Herbaspirillum sp. CF444]EJL85775.1 2-polyprenyl-6-methoxyphenol hydroxylase-like oxidoreductase [Herbaspirillum sp. CF444]